MMKVSINAIEYYLPARKEDNQSLLVDNPDWLIEDIEAKTGIKSRYISDPGQTATDMAVLAAKKLFKSGVNQIDIDFLIFVTQSPDYVLPNSACILQEKLGIKTSCMAFDVNLGCSGFTYGLAIGGSLIETGIAKQGLLVCSDTYSKYIDKNDRACRSVFGDAASASLLVPSEEEMLGPFEMGTDGSGHENLIVPLSGARKSPESSQENKLYMDAVPRCVTSLLEKSELQIEDVDLFVLHQASKLVIDSVIRRLDVPEEKVFVNYAEIGNTVSSSIPIALKDAAEQNKISRGDRVMLVGFGVGYSWGGCLITWDWEK